MTRVVRLAASMAALVWVATVAPTAQASCTQVSASARTMADESVQAAWVAQPATIIVGQPFALLITLCPADARLLRVDASMPEHRHGMNYRASLEPMGRGRWRAEGLLWHMSGHWELRLDVMLHGTEHRLRQSVHLP